MTTKTNNQITDDMIEQARNADVLTVIELGAGGKVKAWCHEDKRPSLYYGNRSKRMICPVCSKNFTALDVLIERDGYSFIDAVRSLQ